MKIIIAGAGAVGTHLAKLLSGEKQDIILMDDDEERLGRLGSNFDLLAVNISPTSISGLKEAGVAGADLFIAVTPDESRNMTACMLATSLGAKKTVARINNYEYLLPKHKEFFAKLGVDSLNLSGNAGSERNCRCRKDELDSSMVGVRWRSISFTRNQDERNSRNSECILCMSWEEEISLSILLQSNVAAKQSFPEVMILLF